MGFDLWLYRENLQTLIYESKIHTSVNVCVEC